MAKFKSEKPQNSVNEKYFIDGETPRNAPVRNKTIAGVLAFFLGFLGVHQFYLKNIGKGILCVIISLILLALFIFNSLLSLDMYWFTVCACIYEAILIIQGLVYIFGSNKRFKKKNKVRTF